MMLSEAKKLNGYRLGTLSGMMGKVKECCFDDRNWTILYLAHDHEKPGEFAQGEKAWDTHLRSTYGVSGHQIQALDGELGHVEDYIIDDEAWVIRYLIINAHDWWPGKKILVSPQWIERISWGERKVYVNLSRETVVQSPEYLEESRPSRDYEIGLHQHYNRQGYWNHELAAR